MSSAQNDPRLVVQRYVEEVWNQGNLAVADEILLLESLDSDKAFVASLRAAFPDLHFTLLDEMTEGDRVTARWIARGVHDGELSLGGMHASPTGLPITLEGVSILRVVEGKIVEINGRIPIQEVFSRLGAVPVATQARRQGTVVAAIGFCLFTGLMVGMVGLLVTWVAPSLEGATTKQPAVGELVCWDALERRREAERTLTMAPPTPSTDNSAYQQAKAG